MSAKTLGFDGGIAVWGLFQQHFPGMGSEGEIDPRHPAKSLVIGVALGAMLKPICWMIREEKIILDKLGDRKIYIMWDEDLHTGQVYGGALSGVLPNNIDPNPTSLVLVPSQLVYWFAWGGLYPETDIYQSR